MGAHNAGCRIIAWLQKQEFFLCIKQIAGVMFVLDSLLLTLQAAEEPTCSAMDGEA